MRVGEKSALSLILLLAILLTMPLNAVSAVDGTKDISAVAEVRITEENIVYSGGEQQPYMEVVLSGNNTEEEVLLEEGVDYLRSFSNNCNAGMAHYCIQGIGAYSGTIEGTFEISPCDLSKLKIKDNLNGRVLEYNAKDRCAVLSVYLGDIRLNPMVDYDVECLNNLDAGTMSIKISKLEDNDNFIGSIIKTFRIEKKDIKDTTIDIVLNPDNTIQIQIINPEAGKDVIKGEDYSYTVVKDGKGYLVVTIKGIGMNYTGSITETIKANPEPTTKPVVPPTTKAIVVSKTEIKKIQKSKKKIRVRWKKIKGVSGYQIRYSRYPSMKKATELKIKHNSKNFSLTTLKKKKKYYLQVRAFKKVGKRCFYAEWSKKKIIKIS